MTVKYAADFNLAVQVNDLKKARSFLSEETMRDYVDIVADDGTPLKDKLERVDWVLENEDSGYIEVVALHELSDNERESLSDWILGQCSDGIGESFEQQEFAELECEEEYYMASFDWKFNKYELIKQ